MIHEITAYINALSGMQISKDNIELIEGDFRTGILRVKLTIKTNNHHLVKDKLIKDKYCTLLDNTFKFIDNDNYECLLRIDYNGLDNELNKPVITNPCNENNV